MYFIILAGAPSARESREPKRVGGRVACGVSETLVAEHPPPLCRLELARTSSARPDGPVNRRVVDNHPAAAVREHPTERPVVSHAVSLIAGTSAIRRAHDSALPASRSRTTGEPFRLNCRPERRECDTELSGDVSARMARCLASS